MGPKLKVLHVIPSLDVADGGPSVAMLRIASALQDRVNLTIATTGAEESGVAGFPASTEVLRFVRQSNFYKVSLPLMLWLWRNVRKFDVVHVHALFSFAPILAGAFALRYRKPLVIRPLGVLNSYGRARRRANFKRLSIGLIEGPLLRRAATVHFTSEQEALEARSLGLNLRETVIPLSVNVEPVGNPELMRQLFPQLMGRHVLLFLARIDPVKNLESLLLALAKAKASLPLLRVLICGKGEKQYVQALQRLADDLQLGEVVIWAGALHGVEKAGAFAVANAYILPSHSENFGIAVVEAMAAGKPVIVSRGVPTHDAIVQAEAGWVVSTDSESICAGILTAFAEIPRLARMGNTARALVEREYSEANMGVRIHRMYEQITS